jgi:hypothetical protein
VDDLFETMRAAKGVGLAAPQVGLRRRILVLNPTGQEEDDLVLVNPAIIARAGDRTAFDEGCLSFPGIYAEISRPDRCTVQAVDLMFTALGGGALFLNHPLQRAFRDIHAAGAHIASCPRGEAEAQVGARQAVGRLQARESGGAPPAAIVHYDRRLPRRREGRRRRGIRRQRRRLRQRTSRHLAILEANVRESRARRRARGGHLPRSPKGPLDHAPRATSPSTGSSLRRAGIRRASS